MSEEQVTEDDLELTLEVAIYISPLGLVAECHGHTCEHAEGMAIILRELADRIEAEEERRPPRMHTRN